MKNNYSSSLNIILEKTLVSSYHLTVIHGKDKVNKINVPLRAFSSVEGFVVGTIWKPTSIMMNKTNDLNKFDYTVYGVLEWKLLGAKVYTQSKFYKGSVIIN